MPHRPPHLLLALFLVGCPKSVIPEYEATRAAVLADPGPAPDDWQPDAALSLSGTLVQALVEEGLARQGTLAADLQKGPARLSPVLEVDKLALAGSDRCEACLQVSVELVGTVAFALGPAKGDIPVGASADFDVAFEATRDGASWQVTAQPRDVRSVKIRVDRDVAGGRVDVTGPMRDWLDEHLLERVKPIRVAHFEAEGLPLRALRVEPSSKQVRIAMLTDAVEPGSVSPRPAKLTDGFQLDIAEQSLLSLARREAFEKGKLSYDVALDPRGLRIGREEFELDLRIWRLAGKGWWRDYTITGGFERSKAGFDLEPATVDEKAQSAGAALADPLALIAEGRILEAIEDAVRTSLPSQTQSKGGLPTTVRVDTVYGASGLVTARGQVSIGDAPKGAPPGGKGPMKRPTGGR